MSTRWNPIGPWEILLNRPLDRVGSSWERHVSEKCRRYWKLSPSKTPEGGCLQEAGSVTRRDTNPRALIEKFSSQEINIFRCANSRRDRPHDTGKHFTRSSRFPSRRTNVGLLITSTTRFLSTSESRVFLTTQDSSAPMAVGPATDMAGPCPLRLAQLFNFIFKIVFQLDFGLEFGTRLPSKWKGQRR